MSEKQTEQTEESSKQLDRIECTEQQSLRDEFENLVDLAVSNIDNWRIEFLKSKTDFERVCFLLKVLESSGNSLQRGRNKIGLSPTGEDTGKFNQKSNEISDKYLSHAHTLTQTRNYRESLDPATKAVFYATSDDQLAKALAKRCSILRNVGLREQALKDGLKALELNCPESNLGQLHHDLALCYLRCKSYAEAETHFKVAFDHFSTNEYDDLRAEAATGMRLAKGGAQNSKLNDAKLPKQSWKCVRNRVEDLKYSKCARETNGCKLLAVPDGVMKLTNIDKTPGGWTMQTTRDVEPGEILCVEKPWAVTLENCTEYCNHCHVRCHNLQPCSDCPHVGFCSDECEAKAKTAPSNSSEEENKHIYDCRGFYLHVDVNQHFHLAFNAFVKIPPKHILDYICSTGPYKLGRGHQAFRGEEYIRDTPPPVIDPSDYSSTAWLMPITVDPESHVVWDMTITAVFYTYCLNLSGYPMKWFEETGEFYNLPTPSNRPDVLPASWIAACMLYHLRSSAVNGIQLKEYISESGRNFYPYGHAIYPTLSLINHSCNPNAYIIFMHMGAAALYSNRFIPKGSQVFISYSMTYDKEPKEMRQNILLNMCGFTCNCEACKDDWIDIKGGDEIKCSSCGKYYVLSCGDCPSCGSSSSANQLKNLTSKIKSFNDEFSGDIIDPESMRRNAECIKEAQELLKQPSQIISELLSDQYLIHFSLLNNKTIGNIRKYF